MCYSLKNNIFPFCFKKDKEILLDEGCETNTINFVANAIFPANLCKRVDSYFIMIIIVMIIIDILMHFPDMKKKERNVSKANLRVQHSSG